MDSWGSSFSNEAVKAVIPDRWRWLPALLPLAEQGGEPTRGS
jgi:hypothetical protein